MFTEKHNFLQLMKANQFKTRVFINGNPVAIAIQDLFVENDEEFTAFIDQDGNKKTIKSALIEVPTFTMD